MTAESAHPPSGTEVQLRQLLQELLTCLRRHQDTPLQEGLDSTGIVQAVSRALSAGMPRGGTGRLADLQSDQSVLDGLIAEALRDEPGLSESPLPVPTGGRFDRSTGKGTDLASWLEQLHAALRATHPAAVEIVALRVEGYPDREIAQRLGLGLRLVRRIIQDLRKR